MRCSRNHFESRNSWEAYITRLLSAYAHALARALIFHGHQISGDCYGVLFVSKRFFSVNLRYSCHDSLSWRRFSFRGDDSLFAATTLFSRRRLSFRGDDSLFAATILFSRRRFSFRGDDCLFVATILFSRRRFSFRGD